MDGSNENLTRNCGAEGVTRKPAVRALRLRQLKNAVVQIVFLFVGNAVIQGKTVVIRKIIDHTVCLRASSQIIGEVGKAALIAF